MYKCVLRKWRAFPKSRRRGAAAVEFAIIAPLFFLLLGGIIEFGQAFRVQHMVSNACRRGVRAAVVAGATSNAVEQKVKAHCARMLSISEEDVAVQIAVDGTAGADLSYAEEGAEISVTVSIPFSKAGVGFFTNTFSDKTLTTTCTLEHE